MKRFLLGASLGAIVLATLLPGFHPASVEPTKCIICGSRGTADAILNLILYAPLGIALALSGLGYGRVFLIGLVLSASIETAQSLIPGRDPSWGDLLFNTLGAVVGSLFAGSPIIRFEPNTRRAARRSFIAALLALGVFVGTGILLQPRLPISTYYGQWTPELGHLDWYDGEVLEAFTDTMPIPSERLSNSREIRASLREQPIIRVVAVAGRSTRGLSSILSVYDDHQREIFLVGPERDDLVYRYRTVAAWLRLDQPDLRFRDGLRSIVPGDTLRIAIEPGARSTCIVVNTRRECDLGFTIGAGWSVLLYGEAFSQTSLTLLTVGWIAALTLLCALWARNHPLTYAAAALIVVGLLLVPGPLGLLPTGSYEWLGLTAGAVAGFALQHIQRKRCFAPPTQTERGAVASPHHGKL